MFALVAALSGMTSKGWSAGGRQGSGTASISGDVVTVLEDGRAFPLSLARVLLRSKDGSVSEVQTGTDGRYSFRDLIDGVYTLIADREAYLRMAYGATKAAQPGTPIALAPGDQVSNMRIALRKGGVIAGVVTGDGGVPSTGSTVSAMPIVIDGNGRPLVRATREGGIGPSETSRTNARGEFRLYGLLPGKYVVQATRPVSSGNPTVRGYFPDATDVKDAHVIELKLGEEQLDLAVHLPSFRSFRVTGSVSSASTAQSATVALVPDILGRNPISIDEAGRFAFAGVKEGSYVLQARAGKPGMPSQWLWGETFVTVSSDVSLSALALREAPDVEGTVVVSDSQQATSANAVVTVVLRPQAPWQQSPPILARLPLGDFRIDAVPPGRYRLALESELDAVGTSIRLNSLAIDGRDSGDEMIDVGQSGLRSVVLTLSRRTQGIDGTLVTPSGLPAVATSVLIFPAARTLWASRSRRIRLVRPDTLGRFAIHDIPPGDYLLIALLDPDASASESQDFLEMLAPHAFSLSLGDGERKSLQLKTAW